MFHIYVNNNPTYSQKTCITSAWQNVYHVKKLFGNYKCSETTIW